MKTRNLMDEKRELPEIVAEILIELQQMRKESDRKWEEQRRFNEEQREINQAQTTELHYHREVLEQHTVELKGLNEEMKGLNGKIADNRQFTEHAFNSFSNLVLDRLDGIKDEMAGMREDFKKSLNLEERVRRVEITLYGKAS